MAFKILSLTGGGMRGIFQAEYLRKLRETTEEPLSQRFDLIAGTSTGAIVAMAVALDIDLARVVDLFKNQGPNIFSGRWLSALRKGPRYDSGLLKAALQNVLGGKSLRQCKTPVLIPVTMLNKFGLHLLSSFQPEDLDLSVVEIILASCAAPTFFGPIKPAGQEATFVDGGLWANNPSLIAAKEAYDRKNIPFSDMKVLCIGNGDRPAGAMAAAYASLRTISSKMIGNVLDMVFATQEAMASDVVSSLVGSTNYMMVSTALPVVISLDDAVTAIEVLPGLADSEATRRLSSIQTFLRDDDVTDKQLDVKPIARSLEDKSIEGGNMFFGKKTIATLTLNLPRQELVRRSRILIVDDEKPDFLQDLKNARFSAEWVPDITSKNMDLLEQQLFDLVLLDFGNVGREFGSDEGLSLLKHIKRVNPAVVILAYTSKALGIQHADFFRLADGVLAKDAGIADSLERIEEALRKAHSIPNLWKSLLAVCGYEPGSEDDRILQDLYVRGLTSPAKLQKAKNIIMRHLSTEDNQKAATLLLTKAVELGVKAVVGS